MAVLYFIALLLHLTAGILDSSGHIETQWICLQGKTKAHCSKESTGPTISSRVGEPNRLHAKKLSRLPVLPYLRRRDKSPPRVVSPKVVDIQEQEGNWIVIRIFSPLVSVIKANLIIFFTSSSINLFPNDKPPFKLSTLKLFLNAFLFYSLTLMRYVPTSSAHT